MALQFYNSFTRKLETFTPSVPGEVHMYHCGPTVYSSPHIGNFRSFLVADLLRRLFDFKGMKVTQVMNITDVGHLQNDEEESGEDKMEVAARREHLDVWQLAERYTKEFFAATEYLGFRPAHEYPRATDHIAEMIAMIETLVAKQHAYVTDEGNVYFGIETFEPYGKLSGNRGDALRAGARVEVNPEKRDPSDFALWKIDPRHQMQWDSPWGRGYPGWHIECSAMSRKFLGDTLDIHTGGEDNVFPHHESEIAQSECVTGVPFVRYWLHARHLLVENKKMAKSLGNFVTVEQLREDGFSGDAVRFALSRAHYREKLNFTRDGLDESERKIRRYREAADQLEKAAGEAGDPSEAVREICTAARKSFEAGLDDDLNISVALAALDGLVAEAFRGQPRGGDASAVLDELKTQWEVLGLLQEAASEELDDPEIAVLIEKRNDARKARDFATADSIRDQLLNQGIELLDTKDGVRWRHVRK